MGTRIESKKNKLTVARMTHGRIVKLNDVLYATDHEGVAVQDIINIETGLTVQKITTSLWRGATYGYRFSINKLKGNLVLVTPQPGLNDFVARLYSERGNCIFALNNVNSIGCWSMLLDNERVIVIIKDNFNNKRAIVWDKNLQKITEHYDGISKAYVDEKEGIVRTIQIKDDGSVVNHTYTMDIMEKAI